MSQGRRPMLLLGPLIWLAVVVVVATVTWRVIDSAGRQVLTSGPTPSLNGAGEPGPVATAKEPRPTKSTPSRRPDPTRSPDGAGGPTGTPGGGATSAAPPAPSAEPSLLPSMVPSQRVEQPDASQAPTQQPSQPAPQPQLRSWRGSAGTVAAVCDGARISLQSVTPNDGWHFEVGDRGPEHIEVEFKTGGEDERGTHVTAGCVSGAPRFSVQADD